MYKRIAITLMLVLACASAHAQQVVNQGRPATSGNAWPVSIADNAARLLGQVTFSSPQHIICDSGCPIGLTDAQLRASAVPVSGTFWQATQPVSIASMPSTPVTGTFFQATQPVSIASMPSTPVTGTFFQATQPVSSTQLPAALVQSGMRVSVQSMLGAATIPVAIANGPLAVSPVYGALNNAGDVGIGNVDVGTQRFVLASNQPTVPVSLATAPTTPVTGTFWQATQPVSLASAPSTPITNANLDIAISALRDAITAAGASAKTLADVVTALNTFQTALGGSTAPVNVVIAGGRTIDGSFVPLPLTPGGASVMVQARPAVALLPYVIKCNALRRTNCQL